MKSSIAAFACAVPILAAIPSDALAKIKGPMIKANHGTSALKKMKKAAMNVTKVDTIARTCSQFVDSAPGLGSKALTNFDTKPPRTNNSLCAVSREMMI